eukprot:3203251-Rhodomonas_salina.1
MPVPVLVLQYRYCKQSCGSDTETMGHGSGDWCALCRGCRDLHVGVRRLYQGACPDSLSMTDDPETRLRPGVLSSMTRCLILGCAAYKCCLCVALIRAMQLAWNVMADPTLMMRAGWIAASAAKTGGAEPGLGLRQGAAATAVR